MTDLQDKIFTVLLDIPCNDRDFNAREYCEVADRILAIPRIAAALAALERDEAMARKLGHSIGARP